jgi:hypothetical protein
MAPVPRRDFNADIYRLKYFGDVMVHGISICKRWSQVFKEL